MEHVSDHYRVLEGVGGGLEPGEQIARDHLRIRGVFGQQRRRRALVAALDDRDDQAGVQAHQRGEELPSAFGEPAGGHHRLIDPHPCGRDRRDLCGRDQHRTHHGVPADPERLADPIDRNVVGRHRHRRPRGRTGPHRPRRNRRCALHEGPAPLDTRQQPLVPADPARPPGDRQVLQRVPPTVVDPMQLDDAAVRASLHVARQHDLGDEFVVVVDVGVGQIELGQSEQQLAPPLDRGRLGHAYGLGRSVGFDTPSIEAVRVLTKHPRQGHPLPRGTPLGPDGCRFEQPGGMR